MQDAKMTQKSPSAHHRTTLSGFVFANKALSTIGKKLVKQQYLPHMSSQYGELRPISGWDLLASLGHPCRFQRVLRLGSVTARQSSSGRQPNFAALNRGRHIYSSGRPSRSALAHISSVRLCVRTTAIDWNDLWSRHLACGSPWPYLGQVHMITVVDQSSRSLRLKVKQWNRKKTAKADLI